MTGLLNPGLPDFVDDETAEDFVTVFIDDQTFGLPIASVHDVFMIGPTTPVPGAPPEVLGLLNLRGRVLTALCLRRLLGLPARRTSDQMVVGVEREGDSFGLVVDRVGEVLRLPNFERQPNPANLDQRWTRFSRGIYWLPDSVLVVLDITPALNAAIPGRAGQASEEAA